jgi:hypothetical protein
MQYGLERKGLMKSKKEKEKKGGDNPCIDLLDRVPKPMHSAQTKYSNEQQGRK